MLLDLSPVDLGATLLVSDALDSSVLAVDSFVLKELVVRQDCLAPVLTIVGAVKHLVLHSTKEILSGELQRKVRAPRQGALSVIQGPSVDTLLAKVVPAGTAPQWASKSLNANRALEL